MIACQRISRLTPLEVDILFTLSGLRKHGLHGGHLTMKDIDEIAPLEEGSMPYHIATQQDVSKIYTERYSTNRIGKSSKKSVF